MPHKFVNPSAADGMETNWNHTLSKSATELTIKKLILHLEVKGSGLLRKFHVKVDVN